MSREHVLRPALWTAAFFNLAGAYPFAMPASSMGQFAGLPPDAPVVYRAMTALFVLLFAGAYAWLAMQPSINRPLVAFGAIGKAAAFLCSDMASGVTGEILYVDGGFSTVGMSFPGEAPTG